MLRERYAINPSKSVSDGLENAMKARIRLGIYTLDSDLV